MSEVGINQIGLGTEISETHTEYKMDGGKRGIYITIVIASAAAEARPTTPAPITTTSVSLAMRPQSSRSGDDWSKQRSGIRGHLMSPDRARGPNSARDQGAKPQA